MHSKKWIGGFALFLLLGLTGCGRGKEDPLVVKKIEQYEKMTHTTEEVKRGDFPNTLSLMIGMEDLSTKEYHFEERAISEMETSVVEGNAYLIPVAELYVKEGDHVKAGDVMAVAVIPNSDTELREISEQVNSLALAIEHDRNLMKIDDTLDLTDQIKGEEEALALAKLRLQELKEQKNGVSLIAQEEGTVSFVDSTLRDYGYFDTWNPMIKVTSGTGKYTVVTDDIYPFREGDIYQAYAGETVYDFELTELREEDTGKRLILTPVSDISGLSDSQKLEMVLEKTPYKDVVYVNKKAVKSPNSTSWVYVVDENGFREARKVTVGDTIDDIVIIQDGLEGGELISVE